MYMCVLEVHIGVCIDDICIDISMRVADAGLRVDVIRTNHRCGVCTCMLKAT